jgi:hypothetical protein
MYVHLRKLVSRIAEKQAKERMPLTADTKILNLSLRGHHFVYPDTAPAGVSSAAVWVAPYIMAAVGMVNDSTWKMPPLKDKYGLVPSGEGLHRREERLSLDSTMAGGFCLARGVPTEQDACAAEDVGQVGLSPNELDTYLEYLATAGGNDEIRTLVVDDLAGLFAVVRSAKGFSDLREKLQNLRSFSNSNSPVQVAPVKISKDSFRLG